MINAVSNALFGSAVVHLNSIPNRVFSLDTLPKFLEDQARYNDTSFEEVSEACIGTRDLSPGVEDRLYSEILTELPSQLIPTFQKWYNESNKSFKEKVENLIQYAENLKRKGDFQSAEKIKEFVVKLTLVPIIRDLNRNISRGFKAALEQLNEILAQIEKFSKYSAQDIDICYLSALIQKIAPKKTDKEKIIRYSERLRPYIQRFLDDHMFIEEADYIMPLAKFPFSKEVTDKRKCFIWMHKNSSGLLLTFCPDENEFRKTSQGFDEYEVSEIFIPSKDSLRSHIPKVESSILHKINSEVEKDQVTDLENRRFILSIPGAKKFFGPNPLTFFRAKFYSKRESGYKNFQREVSSPFKFLSPLEGLKVCQDVANGIQVLVNVGRVSLDVCPGNIVFKKGDDGSITGKIDRCVHLTPPGKIAKSQDPRKNTLAKYGHASFETDRFSFILLLCEYFFNLKNLTRDSQKWERDILTQLEGQIYNPHLEKVVDLKYKHNGFNEEFAKDLLNYVEKLIESEEEGFQVDILKKFAFKMLFFQEVKNLLFDALDVDRLHNEMRSQGISYEEILESNHKIPSLERIFQVLQNAIDKISSVEIRKTSTNCREISLESLKKVVERIDFDLDPNLTQDTLDLSRITSDLHRILNDLLNDSPYIGTEIRLHKDEIWKNTAIKIPFSMWVNISKDKICLEIFPPNCRQALGEGAFKKAKKNIQIEISKEGIVTSTSIAISRLIGLDDWNLQVGRGIKVQESILAIPQANKYFLNLSKKHTAYAVGDKIKQESVCPRFNGTLFSANSSQLLDSETGPIALTTYDFIGFLQRIGKGIALIAENDFTHSDIKTQNIALILEDGRPVPYIFDFDLASKFFDIRQEGVYWIWNSIRQKYGIGSKETDIYSYVLMIAESLLYGFAELVDGDNERILGNFKNIHENTASLNREIRLKHIEKIQERFPSLITQDKVVFFSNPLQDGEIKAEHFEVFDYVSALQAQGKESDALILKRFLAESLYFNKIFNLLAKTFLADAISKIPVGQSSGLPENSYESILKNLEDAGFPKLNDIQEILSYCKGVVEDVDSYCCKQPGLMESIVSFFGWK